MAAAYVLEDKAGAEGQVYGFRLGAFDSSRPLVINPAILVYAGYIGSPDVAEGLGIAVDGLGNVYVIGETSSPGVGFPVTVGPDLTFNGVRDAFVAKVNDSGTALVYAGYIGGAGWDIGIGIAVDGTGAAYVTGWTDSSQASFPVAMGPDLTFNGDRDAFVAKVNASGTALEYAGYIGGAGRDEGAGIAVDAAGNAYVTGVTASSEASFPVTVGPDVTLNGQEDAFVAKVNASGTALDYAGYLGGAARDWGTGIAVDAETSAYLTGFTNSSELSFPVTVGPDVTFNGQQDAFVAKVNAAGTALVYAGYLGGTSIDQGAGIAVDPAGSAYVTGQTNSPQASFPVAVGPDVTFNGDASAFSERDAFVAKVNPSGTALEYAGYVGGADSEAGRGIAVDGAGNAYLTGQTSSSEASFPVTVGPDGTFNGVQDAFLAKVNAAGTALEYAGYLGGAGDDRGYGIAVDAEGNAYVTGLTRSSEASFPVTAGPDVSFNGFIDAFVAKVSRLGDNEIMPHIAVGGVWSTTLTLVNTGDEMITFPLRFWTPTGDPWEVFVEGLGTASEFSITLPAGGALDLALPSQDEIIRTGWAEID